MTIAAIYKRRSQLRLIDDKLNLRDRLNAREAKRHLYGIVDTAPLCEAQWLKLEPIHHYSKIKKMTITVKPFDNRLIQCDECKRIYLSHTIVVDSRP